MWIIGFMMMCQGALLLIGEYLCVEVAWKCYDYNKLYTGLGVLLLGTGLLTAMIGAEYD